MKRFTGIAAAFALFVPAVSSYAQQPPTEEQARQDTVVKQAMRTYQQGLVGSEGIRRCAVQPGHELR